ncbi:MULTISPECIES: RHS repeat-associated core domain-containing protein [unclassified Aeromicrobium]|uniref:RHS repeat-associated core domain-containing protein n=1 Tax=unclassified Aeromicrobium TaxID=2633570 RepID=UPI0037C0DCEC
MGITSPLRRNGWNVAGPTDPFGYLAAAYEYSPYGKTTTVGLGDFSPFRYLSPWQETTSGGAPGHYKLGARFYNTNGMFTQPDALTGSLGDPRTMTSYNYAGADPVNQADPSGYCMQYNSNPTGSYGGDQLGPCGYRGLSFAFNPGSDCVLGALGAAITVGGTLTTAPTSGASGYVTAAGYAIASYGLGKCVEVSQR